MKILIPIGSFYPAQIGGPSNTLFWLSKALAKNYKIKVITTSKGIYKENFTFDSWVKLENFTVIYHRYRIWQLPFKMILTTYKEVKQSDIIILSSFFYIPSILTSVFAIIHNKEVLISPRGELSVSALKYKPFSKKLRLLMSKIILRNRITFHSTSQQETIDIRKKFPKHKILEIPNLMELPEKENSENKMIFLFLGRIHSIKAIENIIEALSINEKFKNSDFNFLIAGKEAESGYTSKLISLINEYNLNNRIEFIGMVNGKKKHKLLSQSKFLFLMSHSENFGNVVIESLSQGTPVVASKGTPWKILEEYNAGYWIDNNPIVISNLIDKLLDLNTSDYLQMRINAYNLVYEKFDINKNVQLWETTLQNIYNHTSK